MGFVNYDVYSIGTTGNSPVGTAIATNFAIYDQAGSGNNNLNILGDVSPDNFTASYATSPGQFHYLGVGTSGKINGFVANFNAIKYFFVVHNSLVPSNTVVTLIPSVTTNAGTQWDLTNNTRNCFTTGTRLRTPGGERAVETLRAGDLVVTAGGAIRPIRWVGSAPVSRVGADPLRVLPIRICADALAPGRPCRDLLVSPGHAILLDGALIHAGALVNGTTIRRATDMPLVFTYHHVELGTHDLLLAENTPAESYLEAVADLDAADWNARDWAVRQGLPDTAGTEEMAYPRIKAARQLPDAIRARITAGAGVVGRDLRAA